MRVAQQITAHMKKELEQVDNDIKDLEERLRTLKRRRKAIESKIECPDLVGKCIKIKDGCTTKYIKVNEITKLSEELNLAQGITVSVTILAIETNYKIENNVSSYLLTDYEIITEEEFNNELINVIGKLCDKVDTITPSLTNPLPEIKPWEAQPNIVVMYGCPMPSTIPNANESRLMESPNTATNNITCK